ncbi:MAG: hypothetical protein U1F83_12255 [Verrucomicrobiota bacterium]
MPVFRQSTRCQFRLRLVRSGEECESELLLTTLAEFKPFAMYCAGAPGLQFAVQALLVRGTPLPPLPGGRRFALHQGVAAVPAGFAWRPTVSAEVLARRFGVTGDALVLWNEDGTITRLHGEQFVPATRGAARATEQALMESK